MEKLEMYDGKWKVTTKVVYCPHIESVIGIYQDSIQGDDKEEDVIGLNREEALALYRFLGEVLK